MFIALFSLIFFGLLCSCLDLYLKSDSLVGIVGEAVKNGVPCRTIVEQYRLKLISPSIRFYDDALSEATSLDDIYQEKKIGPGDLHCLPLLIWNDDEGQTTTDSTKPPNAFDFFKRRGAVAIGKVTKNPRISLTLLSYPAIIVKFGLSETDTLFGKRIRFSLSSADNSTVFHSTTFRANSFRETIAIASPNVKDLRKLSNSSDEQETAPGIRWKKVGFVSRGFSFSKINERAAGNVLEKLLETGALIKNVSVNSNEMTSILRQLRNLSPCQTNLSTRNESIDDVRCWATTKKRYRYQIRFVKRIIEPLFGSNDFLIVPIFETGDDSDYGRFVFLLSQSYYPIVEYNPIGSWAQLEAVVFVARPDQLASLLNAALTFDDVLKEPRRNENEVVSHSRNKQETVDLLPIDYCGKMILNGIVAGKAVFAYELCGPNGLCVNTGSGLKCDCAPGHSGRFCQEVSPPFTVVQKCVLYPTYLTVVNNLTAACPDHTTCVPYAHHCLFNYCENPHGWCLAMEELTNENSRRH